MIFDFDPKLGDKNARRRIAGEIYSFLVHSTELSEKSGKAFEVAFRERKQTKSAQQTRGIHLLCAKIIPHLSKEHNANYSLDDVKDYVKREFDYMRPSTSFEAALMLKGSGLKLNEQEKKKAFDFCKKIKQPRSFAEASKEEMTNLIEQITVWAAEKNWKNVFLDAEEMRSLIKFYESGPLKA